MVFDASRKFKVELDHFGREVDTGLQTLFTYLAVNSAAHGKRAILIRLNETPLFWNTTMYTYQCTYFVVLGRIFDHKSRHNVHRLIRLCEGSPEIFSKKSLASRKGDGGPNNNDWLPEYLSRAYVPSCQDWRLLRKKVGVHQKRYEGAYKEIRDKVFAHKELAEHADIEQLFKRTQGEDIRRIYIFLGGLHQALWQLYHNGRKPSLRQQPYSVKKLLRKNPEPWNSTTIQEHTVREVKQLLDNLMQKPAQYRCPNRRSSAPALSLSNGSIGG